jgi:hypothetical protein
VVFGCGAEKRHSANVDFLDCVCEGKVWPGDGFGELVGDAHDDGDWRDVLRFEVF